MINTLLFENELENISKVLSRLTYISSKYDGVAWDTMETIRKERKLAVDTIESLKKIRLTDPQDVMLLYTLTRDLFDEDQLKSIVFIQDQINDRIQKLGDRLSNNLDIIDRNRVEENADTNAPGLQP